MVAAALVVLGPLRAAPPSTEEPGTPQQQAPAASPDQNVNSAPPGPAPTSSGGNTFLTQDLMTGEWGGLRKKLEDDGFTFTPTYIGEVFGNPSGGMRQGATYDGLLNLVTDFDLEKMSGGDVDGLTLHANAFYIHGAGLSQSFVGDFSNTSNVAAYNTLRLDELWLQKWFWDKKLSLKVGNMALDNEFFQSSSAALFINATFGAPTLAANNLPNPPFYPLATPGIRLQLIPSPEWYVMAGVYGQDANSNPATNNQNGTRFALNPGSGLLVMSEAGYLLNQGPNDKGLQGTYRLGSFVHTDDSPTFAGGDGGTGYGVYGVLDQQIYSRDPESINFFVRSGSAPSNTNFVDWYVDGGFNFNGFTPGRKDDVLGVAVARSRVSPDFSNASVAAGGPSYTAETVIEATYKAQIAPWWSVQPDFQYIVTPSGAQYSHNATVIGLRTTLAF